MDGELKTTNFILATVLIFLVLILWQFLFYKPSPQKATQNAKSDTTQVVKSENVAGVNPTNTIKIDTLFSVETPLYIAHFNKSGGIVGFKVKNIGNLKEVELISEGSIAWFDQGLTYKLEDSTKNWMVADSDLSISLISEDGQIRKVFTFYRDKYIIDVKYQGLSKINGAFYGSLRLTEKSKKQESGVHSYLLRKKNTIKINVEKLKEAKTYELSQISWFGTRTKYFFSALISENKPGILQIKRDSVFYSLEGNNFALYFGPLDYLILKKNHKGLSSAYDFGSWLVKPFSFLIYFLLKGLHKVIPNYGFVIIIFALLMKLAFFPLTRNTIIASKKMQELKPKLDTLQKIYANDPQKLQREMMELYRKYKVNPFSGCLTLLIQLPIFFALYQILTYSISLKGAPFILWIKDLSDKDPYYILPILMGVTSIILSKIQQTAVDTQSKMLMYLMPLIMIFIFISLPSGIVLYWFVFNVFGIFEALFIKGLEGHHDT